MCSLKNSEWDKTISQGKLGPMNFTDATPDLLPRLDVFVNSAYRGDYSKQGWTTEADLLGGQRTDAEKLAEMIGEPGAVIRVLQGPQSILGCVYLKQTGESVYLGMLTVEPQLQGRGLGAKLLQEAEVWARAHGATRIRMTVIRQRPELLAYYQRKGYQLTGHTEDFPSNDPRFGLPKQGDLEFLELAKEL